MPWKEQTMSEKRTAFVEEVLQGIETKKALCARHGISRPTGDKWIKRYLAGEGMENQSRAPRHSPKQTDPQMEKAILTLRQEYPAYGAKKLKRMMEKRGQSPPAHSTVHDILKRNGCISEAASQAARRLQRFERKAPNELWQTDFKGHFALENGMRCHPLNILDDHSRYLLALDAKENEQHLPAWETFERAMRTYGLPEAILCDNGNPWGSNWPGGFTLFERMLLDLDIQPIHGKPRHPQTQGKDERFNQTLARELLAYTTLRTMPHAQAEFDAFKRLYNEVRPHHALGLGVPADRYQPSTRPFPQHILRCDYAPGLAIRSVQKGRLKFKGEVYYFSGGFEGCQVALRQDESREGMVEILYRNWQVATLDMGSGKVTRALHRVTTL